MGMGIDKTGHKKLGPIAFNFFFRMIPDEVSIRPCFRDLAAADQYTVIFSETEPACIVPKQEEEVAESETAEENENENNE